MASNVKRLFFDIETKVDKESLSFMPEPKAPANWKDPEKIEAFKSEKRDDWTATAPLDADYGQIAAIAWTESLYAEPVVAVVKDDITEERIIRGFWKAFTRCGGNCVGYSVISFDLPYLLRRSFHYGIPAPYVNLAKYRTEPITDLFQILYNWFNGKALKFLANRYGLVNPVPHLEGSKVADMDPGELGVYVLSDVNLVRQLFMKMNGVYFRFPDTVDYVPEFEAFRDHLKNVVYKDYFPEVQNGPEDGPIPTLTEVVDAIKTDQAPAVDIVPSTTGEGQADNDAVS